MELSYWAFSPATGFSRRSRAFKLGQKFNFGHDEIGLFRDEVLANCAP